MKASFLRGGSSVRRIIVVVAFSGLFAGGAAAIERGGIDFTCANVSAQLAAAVDSPDYRKYAPGREVVTTHLAIDVTPDFKQRSIKAKASLQLKVAASPVRVITLDAVNLRVIKLESTEKLTGYEANDETLTLTFAEPLAPGKPLTVTVEYTAEPERGLYFRTAEMGYRKGDDHLFTQGESVEARHWYPCLDSPNQMFTSEMTCRVPAGMTAVSNGKLESESTDPSTDLRVFHWRQDKPHANYLVTLTAGYFKRVESTYGEVPLAFYTPASEILQASNSFRNTARMMKFFEQYTGVTYPWAKYDQICVNDFVAGGMENTSATTLTDGTLSTDATENLRDSDGLVAHELAHQWFGDLVTCKDWSHLWLNEGFATYFESLWVEHDKGRDEMNYELYQRARSLTGTPGDGTPIVRRTFDKPDQMFDHLAYGKASWVLHMLRNELGEEHFRQAIKLFLEKHRHGNVVTDDLREIAESLSGKPLDRFFDQWLYFGGCPDLQISYVWDEPSKMARISVRQVQPVTEKVMLFTIPLEVSFKTKTGSAVEKMQVKKKEEDFYFPLASSPEVVRIDPRQVVLARISFSPPRQMINVQLKDDTDVVGRLIAIEQLAGRQDREAVDQLKTALNRDKFYGVRIEAAKALGRIRSPEAREALMASLTQGDARVRQQVADSVGDFFSQGTYETIRAALPKEKNPLIVGTWLRAGAPYGRPEFRTTLLEYLNADSYRDEVAQAAMDAIRIQDDPYFVGLLLETLVRREPEFGSAAVSKGIQVLGYLARDEKDKEQVRTYLVRMTTDPRRRVRLASLAALGTLGDERAIPVLQTFVGQRTDNPEQRAAASGLAEVRRLRKPSDELDRLRQEILELQKTNRELKQQMEDLSRKVSAAVAPPLAPAKARKK